MNWPEQCDGEGDAETTVDHALGHVREAFGAAPDGVFSAPGRVNIIGEHATYHLKHDAPLTSDIEGVARPMSHWVKTAATSKTLAAELDVSA